MTHLLDSSAWLAHLLGEPGVDQVALLFDDPTVTIHVSVLSLLEMHGRLKALGQEARWPHVWATYSLLFERILPVSQAIAEQAIRLRSAASERVPTIDALIAGTAVVNRLTLVHRDPHFASIPTSALLQLPLPEE
jgi:hypothetical protein